MSVFTQYDNPLPIVQNSPNVYLVGESVEPEQLAGERGEIESPLIFEREAAEDETGPSTPSADGERVAGDHRVIRPSA